jgi:hypothetical protein
MHIIFNQIKTRKNIEKWGDYFIILIGFFQMNC